MTREELAVIDEVVRTAGWRLSPEDRFDLRQELAIKLLAKKPHDPRAFAHKVARNLVADWHKRDKRYREILHELEQAGPPRGYRKGPKWYPPCEGAKEFAPFACEGARVMSVNPSRCGLNEVEDAIIKFLDE